MASYSPELSAHLKNIRTIRGLTLQELSQKSGVSRATLSRIENAEASPTAETLGLLSSAYQVPISELLKPLDETFPPLVTSAHQPVWEDKSCGFTRRNVSPPANSLSIEVIEGQIKPNQIITYEKPSIPGQEHHLIMIAGSLFLSIEGTEYHLQSGDCLRFKLFGKSRYCTKEQEARYYIALTKGS